MEDKTIEIRRNVVITGEDIDVIMACALDAGISYWCKEAEVEGDYLDFTIQPEEQERYGNGVYAFYLLWDAINTLSEDIERISGDGRIIDVIEAIKK